VLDAGCGTGENALHVASLGLPVLGIDAAETALAIARAKADDRGIEGELAAAAIAALFISVNGVRRSGTSERTRQYATWRLDRYRFGVRRACQRSGTPAVLTLRSRAPDSGWL
jgi:SAM-dependent methyltransferase